MYSSAPWKFWADRLTLCFTPLVCLRMFAKKRTYDDLDYDMLGKTLDISAVSFHKMIQAAKKLNAIADYGSILALSYVAAQRTFYGYNDMADAKALLESLRVASVISMVANIMYVSIPFHSLRL